MDLTQRILLAAHILAGLVGLLTMLPPLLSRKGGRLHRRIGWGFVAAMAAVSVSGLALASFWMAAPGRYRPDMSADAAQLQGAFLVLVGLLTGNALVQAMTAISRKRSRAARFRALEIVPLLTLTLWALLCLGLGLWLGHPLMLVFATGSLAAVVGDARFSFRPLPSAHAWLYQHMSAMATACISAVTAFLVLGGRRWFTFALLGESAWLAWIAPGVILGAVFRIWIWRTRHKLERPPSAVRGIVADAPG